MKGNGTFACEWKELGFLLYLESSLFLCNLTIPFHRELKIAENDYSDVHTQSPFIKVLCPFLNLVIYFSVRGVQSVGQSCI